MSDNILQFPTAELSNAGHRFIVQSGNVIHGKLKIGTILLDVSANLYVMVESYADLTQDEYDVSYVFKRLSNVADAYYKESLGVVHGKILSGELLYVNSYTVENNGRIEHDCGLIYKNSIVGFINSGAWKHFLYIGREFESGPMTATVTDIRGAGVDTRVYIRVIDSRSFWERLKTGNKRKYVTNTALATLIRHCVIT